MADLHITTIQSDLVWENKEANLSNFENKFQLLESGVHVVFLPEMFSTGFSMAPERLAETMTGPTVTWMEKMAAKYKIIISGSIIIEENGKYFNRLIWMQPNKVHYLYDKRHLFGYGGEDKHYTPGNKRVIVSVNGWRILLQVCYDLRFPVWARQEPEVKGSFEYDAILYVANWPEKRKIAWTTLLQARAIENQSYVIGVNRIGNDGNHIYHSGDSRIIDPLGTIYYQAEEQEEMKKFVLEKEKLDAIRSRFPFAKDADDFQIR